MSHADRELPSEEITLRGKHRRSFHTSSGLPGTFKTKLMPHGPQGFECVWCRKNFLPVRLVHLQNCRAVRRVMGSLAGGVHAVGGGQSGGWRRG